MAGSGLFAMLGAGGTIKNIYMYGYKHSVTTTVDKTTTNEETGETTTTQEKTTTYALMRLRALLPMRRTVDNSHIT